MYWHNLALIFAWLFHAIPAVLLIAAILTAVVLLIAVVAWIEGDRIGWEQWLLLLIFGPGGVLLTLPWAMEVYR